MGERKIDGTWVLTRVGDGLLFTDSMGHIMPVDQALELIDDLRMTYVRANVSAIDAHNARIDRDLVASLYGVVPDWRFGDGDECVYVLEAVGLGDVYKIGRTANMDEREQDFATLPFQVKRIHVAYTPDSHELERWLHQRFQGQRINGEWFRLDASQLKELLEALRSA